MPDENAADYLILCKEMKRRADRDSEELAGLIENIENHPYRWWHRFYKPRWWPDD